MVRVSFILLLFLCFPVRAVDTVLLAVANETAYDAEVAKQVLELAGYSVETKIAPWARCLAMIRQGEVDVLANVFKTPERMKFMHYGEEQIFHFKQFLYAKRDSNHTFNGDVGQLKGLVIGVRHGFSYGEAFDSAIRRKVIMTQTVNLVIQNFRMLALDRIDMFVENPMNMIEDLGEQGGLELFDDLEMLRPAVSSQPTYLVVSKSSRFGLTLSTDIDKALLELKASGQYAKILKSHFGEIEIQ